MIYKQFDLFLKSENIHHYLAYIIRKCPVIERFNITIKQLLNRNMAKNNSLNSVGCIDQALKNYLNRKDRE